MMRGPALAGRLLKGHGFLAASVGLFVACLCLDAFYYPALPEDRSAGIGFGFFLMGWLGLLKGIPAWLANPALVAAWVASLRRRHRHSFWLSLAAIVLMLSFLVERDLPQFESSRAQVISSHGWGYWCWVGSAFTQMLGSSRGIGSVAPRHAEAEVPGKTRGGKS